MQQPQQAPPLVFVIPDDYRERSIDFYFISADRALMKTSKGLGTLRESLLLTTNAAGEIQKSQPIAWARGTQTDNRLQAFFGTLAIPSLLVTGILLLGIVPSQPNYQQQIGWNDAGYLERVGIALADAWPALLVLVIISCVLTWLALRWHRQYARLHLGAWAALIFLFGVPGFIAYWAYHRRPILETCPECGKAAPRDRAACSHCQQTFAEPSLAGTEIFV